MYTHQYTNKYNDLQTHDHSHSQKDKPLDVKVQTEIHTIWNTLQIHYKLPQGGKWKLVGRHVLWFWKLDHTLISKMNNLVNFMCHISANLFGFHRKHLTLSVKSYTTMMQKTRSFNSVADQNSTWYSIFRMRRDARWSTSLWKEEHTATSPARLAWQT